MLKNYRTCNIKTTLIICFIILHKFRMTKQIINVVIKVFYHNQLFYFNVSASSTNFSQVVFSATKYFLALLYFSVISANLETSP
jgi:hypothetical protein